jgi:hypothetical protein
MIKALVIPVAIMLGCGSVKSTQKAADTDSVVVVTAEADKAKEAEKAKQAPVITNDELNAAVPGCIKKKIDSFRLKEPHERPQSVMEYTYKGKKVYYVVMPCCDFFNEVYDANCNYLGAPDGGFTGKGDGKIPDFAAEAKNEKLIWKAAK